MTDVILRIGARGREVKAIQEVLTDCGYYRGPIDLIYGGGTQSAIKCFQRDKGLPPTGEVDAATWRKIFGGVTTAKAVTVNHIALMQPIGSRCLSLTGSFETGLRPPDCFAALAGDFDGQGMSFGALQWNMGQGTLQRVLADMVRSYPGIMVDVFHDRSDGILAMLGMTRKHQLRWARDIQTPRHAMVEPWAGMFRALGRTLECRTIQLQHAQPYLHAALTDCLAYGLLSERATALLFDVRVQNGGLDNHVRAMLEADFERHARESSDAGEAEWEAAKLRIIAKRVAEASIPRWAGDVLARKLCIADGKGVVHGRFYDLEAQYGIRLSAYGA